VRGQVGAACLDILAEGKVGFGPGEVAARAGVSRATVHRWWPTKAHLVREALALHTRSLALPDSGSWPDDVRLLAHGLASFFAQPIEVALNALMASGEHPDYTAAVLEHFQPLFADWRAVVERARERGELVDGVDADTVLLTLLSPLVLVPLLFRRTLTDGEVGRVAGLVVRATSARAPRDRQ
jgi:AcrR family transcriptional regulator